MAKLGRLTHDQFPADVCISHTRAAENVAMASGDPVQALVTIDRAMIGEGPCPHATCAGSDYHSHGHYLNIVNPAFRRVGIGVYVHNGFTWVTEDFTD